MWYLDTIYLLYGSNDFSFSFHHPIYNTSRCGIPTSRCSPTPQREKQEKCYHPLILCLISGVPWDLNAVTHHQRENTWSADLYHESLPAHRFLLLICKLTGIEDNLYCYIELFFSLHMSHHRKENADQRSNSKFLQHPRSSLRLAK